MAPRWTGEKNNKNVRLPDDLHSAVKAKAAVRGFTVEDAYEEGMTQWVEPSESPFIDLTAPEEQLLTRVLTYWRELPAKDPIKMFFAGIASGEMPKFSARGAAGCRAPIASGSRGAGSAGS